MPHDNDTITLHTTVRDLPGIRPDDQNALIGMGLTNLGRLVAHLPSRHEREEAEAPIESLEVGRIISARGDVTSTRVSGFGRKKRFEAVLSDGTGRLDLIWFNQAFLAKKIGAGTRLRVQGTLKSRGTALQLANPRYWIIEEELDTAETSSDARLRPVYPATERLSTRAIEAIIGRLLPLALPLIEDHFPEPFRTEREMPTLAESYRMMHTPKDESEPKAARRRLAYDELLMLQIGVHLKRAHLRESLAAPALPWNEQTRSAVTSLLPFELTEAQSRVVEEIGDDLANDRPMNRLVQGDVGSGKTAVALCAMLAAVSGEHQAALMAPTSLLAEQHYQSITALLKETEVRVDLLTGSTAPADRTSILHRIANGKSDIVIGTHALLTDKVAFHALGLAIIDEQHRFGVVVFRKGRFLKEWSLALRGPLTGLAYDPYTKHLGISDMNTRFLHRFETSTGRLLRVRPGGRQQKSLLDLIRLNESSMVRADGARGFVVVDREGKSMARFDAANANVFGFEGRWGAVDIGDSIKIAAAPDGDLVILNTSQYMLSRVNYRGWVKSRVGGDTFGFKFKGPTDVAVGPQGNMFVLDASVSRVYKFTPQGYFSTRLGSPGDGPNQLNSCIDMECSGTRENLVILQERKDHNVHVMKVLSGKGFAFPRVPAIDDPMVVCEGVNRTQWIVNDDMLGKIATGSPNFQETSIEFDKATDATTSVDGFLYFVDGGDYFISVHSRGGAQISKIKLSKLPKPLDIAMDNYGTMYVG